MVVRDAVFWINGQHAVESGQSLLVAAIEVEHPAQVAPRRPILGKVAQHPAIRLGRGLVAAVLLQHHAPDPRRLPIAAHQRLAVLQMLVGSLQVAVAHGHPSQVAAAIQALGCELFHRRKGPGGPLGVVLEQQANAIVVEARPVRRIGRTRCGRRPHRQFHLAAGDLRHRQLRHLVEAAEPGAVAVEGKFRISAVELAPQQPRPQRQLASRVIGGHPKTVVGHVRRTRANGADVHGGDNVLGVAPMDGLAVCIDHQRLVKVRLYIDVPVVLHRPVQREHRAIVAHHRDL